jgi:malonyl CoA-acyl carrier protein transacylase
MTTFVFPGQGSQKKGMGADLFDTVPEFAQAEQDINHVLGYSIRQLCLEDPGNQLKQTQYTQPALFIVNALHYYQAIRSGASPKHLAGHSLGEYNALHAAGAFDLFTGVQLVKRRGELMAQATNGGMAAVIGMAPEQVAKALADNRLMTIDVANFNSPSQTVVSGPVDDIKRAAPMFEKAGARMYVPLPVSAAFHSRYMAEAAASFEAFLAKFTFSSLKAPVIANVTGLPYPSGNTNLVIRSFLSKQITQSVLWTQSVCYLLQQGATEFIELGPGNVLTRLIQEIQKPA